MFSKQKIIITSLATALAATFVWFVIIDNLIIPTIQQENKLAYQNGYNNGIQNSITDIFTQSNNCQPLSIWIGNDTKQIIDVACLQSAPSDSEINQ